MDAPSDNVSPASTSGTPTIVLGSGGHARVVVDALVRCGVHPEAVIDIHAADGVPGEEILGIPVRAGLDQLWQRDPGSVRVALAVGENRARANLVRECSRRGLAMPPMIHPDARVAPSCTIGDGSFVGCGALVSPEARIGRGAVVNTGAIVEHEVVVGDFAHIGPGSIVAGRARIGEGALLGIGCRVVPDTAVGEWSTAGAGSVVLTAIPDGETVAGIPARPLHPSSPPRGDVPAEAGSADD